LGQGNREQGAGGRGQGAGGRGRGRKRVLGDFTFLYIHLNFSVHLLNLPNSKFQNLQ